MAALTALAAVGLFAPGHHRNRWSRGRRHPSGGEKTHPDQWGNRQLDHGGTLPGRDARSRSAPPLLTGRWHLSSPPAGQPGNQREYVAYHERLREAGHVATNGPVDGQPDPSLRGLTFYRTGSLDRSRQLAEDDPAVRAGRLAVDIMTWYCPPGTMSRPGRTVTLS